VSRSARDGRRGRRGDRGGDAIFQRKAFDTDLSLDIYRRGREPQKEAGRPLSLWTATRATKTAGSILANKIQSPFDQA